MSKSDYLSLAGILSALCFSAALLLSFPAAAQNNECSMMCNGIDNQCYRSCAGSNDGLSPFGPAPGSGASRSSYGAIAISDSDKGALRWGKAYGYESRARAEAAAVRFCMAGGLPGCRVRLWFFNACAALVTTSDGTWWTDWRGSLAAARQVTLAECEQDAKGRCTVREAFCSL